MVLFLLHKKLVFDCIAQPPPITDIASYEIMKNEMQAIFFSEDDLTNV
jgi:hypothetical protein